MTKTLTTGRPILTAAVLSAMLLALAMPADAGVKGALYKRGAVTPITGEITWYSASQQYNVNNGSLSLRVDANQVARIDVPRPPELDSAIKMVQARQYAMAKGPLETVAKDYEMLEWDLVAARYLAECYLNMNMARQAITMVDKISRVNPKATQSGELQRLYWDALEKDGQTAKLNSVLGQAIKSGSREVAAVAQIRRADSDRLAGNTKKALVDGYLRTALLFRDVKSVQPEALWKAAESFQQIGQTTYAEKMRKRLIEQFPQSPEAQKARAGG
jgi:TolA-binding protein